MLLVLAEVEVVLPTECIPIGLSTVDGVGGDVNCNGEFDLLDLLTSLKLVGSLPLHPCFSLEVLGFGAVGANMGPDGGTLTTTGLNGTSFTLDIPEGALLGPEQIRMMPVDGIPNLPAPGGLVGAVDLQPTGLQFWQPVVLTIDPPAEIPVGEQTPFVISQGEFVVHPLVVDSDAIQLPLTHFSAAGLTRGPVDILPPNSEPLGAYTAAAAALVLPQREALLGGGAGDPQFAAKLAELFDGYYEAHLAPGLEPLPVQIAGLGACPVQIGVIAQGLGLSGQATLLGRSSTSVMTALERLGPTLPDCRNADLLKCVADHDLSAIARIAAFSHVMTLLGIAQVPSLEDMMEKCARFEMHLASWFCTDEMSANCTAGISYSFITNDWIPFTLPLTTPTGPIGAGPTKLNFGEWNEHQNCRGAMDSPGSTLDVFYGAVSMNSFTTRRPSNVAPIELYIHPGIPGEFLALTCDGSGTDIQEDTLWWRKWCSFHQRELVPPHPDPSGYCLGNEKESYAFNVPRAGWVQDAPDAWRLEISKTYTQAGVAEIGWEDTTIRLRHRPLP